MTTENQLLRDALHRIKHEAVSLADAQVIALEALTLPAQQATPEPEWLHLKPYGYAPGNYSNKCIRCSTMVEGVDKRAYICRPCALTAAQQGADHG